MRLLSLSDKIVLYFVIIGITAIAVVSTYSFYSSKQAMLDRTFNQLTSVRVVKKGQVEQFFNDRLGDLALASRRFGNSDLSDHDYFPEHLQQSGYYIAVYYGSPKNETVHSIELNNDRHDLHEKEIQSTAILEDVLLKAAQNPNNTLHDCVWDSLIDQPRLFVSGPVIGSSSEQPQFVILEIALEAINAIMLEQNPADGLGKSGESYLVGSDRLMRSTSRFQNNSILKTRVQTQAVEWAFSGGTGTSVINDYRGVKVLSSYSMLDISVLQWAILAEIDYEEATHSIYLIRNRILLITIVVSFVVFIISFLFSKRIISPLIKLNEATLSIQDGNLDVILPRTKNDEIGQLTNSFNNMTNTLKEKNRELQQERNKRFTAMIDGQEIERQRLSRELHDGLGQSVIALKLKIEGLQGKNEKRTQQSLNEINSAFDSTINEIRRISNDLMPAVLKEFGLVTAVKNICNDTTENTPIHMTCSCSGKFNNLNEKLTIYLFRILQEALNNMIKHSEADEAEVVLKHDGDSIYIALNDNGRGFGTEPRSKPSGNGIPNMRERVHLLGGEILFLSNNGKGTQINIEIPIKQTDHEYDQSNPG